MKQVFFVLCATHYGRMPGMKILSWNVNGLRAINRKSKWQQILDLKPDVIFLQETKASPDQLKDNVRDPKGYYSFFCSSTARKGYSGVATYTKSLPDKEFCGLDIKKFDEHGRVHTIVLDNLALVNAYFPNGKSKTASLEYKEEFFEEFFDYMSALKQDYQVIFGGDVNVAHQAIDLARPEDNKDKVGFLPKERAWVDKFEKAGFVDIFRHEYPEKEEVYTYWSLRTKARDRNVGWRIDYFWASQGALSRVTRFETLSDIYGSDHCPIMIELKE